VATGLFGAACVICGLVFDCALRLMHVTVLFLVLDNLAIQLVGEAVNRRVHVSVFGLYENVLAAQVDVGFDDVLELFTVMMTLMSMTWSKWRLTRSILDTT
jgi:hypothetical protein